MASFSSNVVGVHYRVGKRIGEGSFGVIFEGTNLLDNSHIAIKFEPRKSDAPQLKDEYMTYKILVGRRKLRPFLDKLDHARQRELCLPADNVIPRVMTDPA